MNRRDEQRLRTALKGTGLEDLAADLAERPTPDQIIEVIKGSRKAGVADDQERRRRKREARRRSNLAENMKCLEGAEKVIESMAERAGEDIDLLAPLAKFFAREKELLGIAVDGLREVGCSDGEIADELGKTRQAVEGRFPRRTSPATGNGDQPVRGQIHAS